MKRIICLSSVCLLLAACNSSGSIVEKEQTLMESTGENTFAESTTEATTESTTESTTEDLITETAEEDIDMFEPVDELTYSEVVQIEADYDAFYGFDEVDMATGLLVLGEFIGSPKQYVETVYDKEFGKEVYVNGSTKCSFRVDKVLCGDASEGDIYEIYLPYSICNEQFISVTNLAPVKTGDKRMLSLYSWDGMYYIKGEHTGMFPWPTEEEIRAVSEDKSDDMDLSADRFGILEISPYHKDAYIGLIKKYFN